MSAEVHYYVHRNLINYLQHGTEKRTESTGEENLASKELEMLIKKHEDIIDSYKSRIEDDTGTDEDIRVKEMEDFYSMFFFSNDEQLSATLNDEKETQRIRKLREDYQKAIEGIIKKKTGGKSIRFNENLLSGEYVVNDNEYINILKTIMTDKIHEIDKNANFNYRTTYYKKAEQILTIINKMTDKRRKEIVRNAWLDSLSIATDDKNKLMQAIQEIGNTLKYIVSSFDKGEIKIDNEIKKIPDKILKENQENYRVLHNGKDYSILDFINYAIKIFGQLPNEQTTSANLSGYLGELGAVIYAFESKIAEQEGRELSIQIFQQFLEQNNKKNTNNNIYFEGESKSTVDYKKSSVFTIQEGDFKITKTEQNSTGSHTSKIDIYVPVLNGTLDEGKGKKAGASVKNYNTLSGNLTVIKGTPIHTLLHSLDITDKLEGHYANLIAEQNNNTNTNFDKKTYRNDIQNLIQQQALINALEGYDKDKVPELFIAFGHKQQKVKVYNMAKLIGRIFQKLLKKEQKFSVDFYKTSTIDIDEANGRVRGKKTIEETIPLKNFIIKNNNEENVMTNAAVNLFKQHKIHVQISLALGEGKKGKEITI